MIVECLFLFLVDFSSDLIPIGKQASLQTLNSITPFFPSNLVNKSALKTIVFDVNLKLFFGVLPLVFAKCTASM